MKIIWSCTRFIKYSFLINGHRSIRVLRGLRQGDPLFPFLFLFVVDDLNRMVSKGVEGGILEGFELGVGKVSLSHFQFADKIIFFCSGKEESVIVLNYMLGFWRLCWGLRSIGVSFNCWV